MVYRDHVNVRMASVWRLAVIVASLVLVLLGPARAAPDDQGSRELLVAAGGGAPFSTISGAVAAATPGSVIRVRPGLYHESVVIDKSLTIVGFAGDHATILDGEGRRGLIRISGSVVLRCENLEFRHGHADRGPAALLADGAMAEFLNCTFHDNLARTDGGAVAVAGLRSWADFVGCHFQRNRAGRHGGAVSAHGTGELTFRGCTFFANVATGAAGAVDAQALTPLVVERCLFIENEGPAAGALRSAGGPVLLQSNTFFRNLSLDGASVAVAAATPDLDATIIRNIFCSDLGGAGLAVPSGAEHACNLYFDNFSGPLLAGAPAPDEQIGNPEFCDFRSLDLTLRRSSPAGGLDATDECGLIGALDIGCLEVIEASGWAGSNAPHRLVR